jgi:hypothetical protein
MSSGSSGYSVTLPDPSRLIFRLMRRMMKPAYAATRLAQIFVGLLAETRSDCDTLLGLLGFRATDPHPNRNLATTVHDIEPRFVAYDMF